MDELSPSDLRTILHSKRANLYYLEHCRVLVNGGRVEYVTETGKRQLYWNLGLNLQAQHRMRISPSLRPGPLPGVSTPAFPSVGR